MIPKRIDQNYLLAEIPEPYHLLGREMLPFSIGHWVALERWGCWPVRNQEEYLVGIIFCSMRYREILQWMTSDIWSRIALWRITRRLRKYNEFQKIKLWKMFQAYLQENFFEPGYVVNGDSFSTSLPAPLHLKLFLMRDFGMSESEVMDYPLKMAMFLLRADQEAKSAITVFDKAEAKEAANEFFRSTQNPKAN